MGAADFLTEYKNFKDFDKDDIGALNGVCAEEKFGKDAKSVDHMDGITVDYGDWWFNVRPSNTEPLLRLNVEANSKELMEQKRDELLAFIRG